MDDLADVRVPATGLVKPLLEAKESVLPPADAATQMKELSALTQKVVSETTEPIRNGITEPFKLAS